MREPRARGTAAVLASCRFDKNGPPPHCTFTVCTKVSSEGNAMWHMEFRSHERQTDVTPINKHPCDGHCKGWFTVKQHVNFSVVPA